MTQPRTRPPPRNDAQTNAGDRRRDRCGWFSAVLGVAGYTALAFGWHPIPSTALGCSLHKRFNSWADTPRITSTSLGLAQDCLEVKIDGTPTIVREPERIAAIRAWFDSRSDLWIENLFNSAGRGRLRIEIRACNRSAATDTDVYVTDDWIGFAPSKNSQRRSAVMSGGSWPKSCRARDFCLVASFNKCLVPRRTSRDWQLGGSLNEQVCQCPDVLGLHGNYRHARLRFECLDRAGVLEVLGSCCLRGLDQRRAGGLGG